MSKQNVSKKVPFYVEANRIMPTKRVIIGVETSATRAINRNDNHKTISMTVTTIIEWER